MILQEYITTDETNRKERISSPESEEPGLYFPVVFLHKCLGIISYVIEGEDTQHQGAGDRVIGGCHLSIQHSLGKSPVCKRLNGNLLKPR